MDEQDKDREQDSCARCRWMEFQPLPYGAVEYSCARRQEPLTSTALTKRRCPEFER